MPLFLYPQVFVTYMLMETQLPLAPGIGGALAFAIAYLLTGLPLKIVGAARYVGPLSQKLTFFTVVPFYSPRSWQCSPLLQSEHLRFALGTAAGWSLLCLCTYALYWQIVHTFAPSAILRAYMAFPSFYVLTETLGALFRLLFLSSGRLLTPIHNSPLFAHSLAHFWGRCWNRWVGEWLRHLFFAPLMRHPRLALLAAFIASGLWHELILTAPHYLMGNPVQVGTMTAYFILQGVGILIEPKHNIKWLRHLYMYVFVIGPAPLVANSAFLHAFFL